MTVLQNFINVVDIFESQFPANAGVDIDGNLTAAGTTYAKAERQLLVAVRMKLRGKANTPLTRKEQTVLMSMCDNSKTTTLIDSCVFSLSLGF